MDAPATPPTATTAAATFPVHIRDLRADERDAMLRCLAMHHPTRRLTRASVEWESWLVMESADDACVIETRLRLDHLSEHPPAAVAA